MKLTIKQQALAALASVAVVLGIGSAFFPKISSNLIMSKASDDVVGSIVFSRSTGTQTNSTDYYYTSGSTQLGTTVYLRNATKVPPSSNHVAVMCSTFDKGSVEPLITFTIANTGTSLFEFQYITSISAVGDGTESRTMTVEKSVDGSVWTSAGTLAATSAGNSNTDVAGAKYIKLTYSGFYNIKLTSFTISYGCSKSGQYTPGGEKSMTGIAVKTAPTKIEYTEGDNFDPTGLVITASYSDLSTEDIKYDGNESDFSFSPSLSDELTTDDTSVTITYNELDCYQSISVSEASAKLISAGTYTNGNYVFVLNANGSGSFVESDYYSKINFDWVENNGLLNFSFAAESTIENKSITKFAPFWDSNVEYTSSNSATVTGTNTFSLKMYRKFGEIKSSTLTFTKSA